MIAHIVLFEPKGDIPARDLRVFAQTLQDVCRAVPSVKRATAGRIAPEQHLIGHTTYHYAAVIEFDDTDGLRDYLSSPIHKDLARMFWSYCESTVILDVDAIDLKTASVDQLLV